MTSASGVTSGVRWGHGGGEQPPNGALPQTPWVTNPGGARFGRSRTAGMEVVQPWRPGSAAETRLEDAAGGNSSWMSQRRVTSNMCLDSRRGGGGTQRGEGRKASVEGAWDASNKAGHPIQRGGVQDPPPQMNHSMDLPVMEGGRPLTWRKARTCRNLPLPGRTCCCRRYM